MKMGLQNIKLKYVYDSDQDDILNEFYVPALSESIHYKRLAGSFSSSALAVAARGITRLIKNGGTMQLVVGAELRPDDVDAIMRGSKEREQVIADIMIKDLESIEDEFVKDHVKALAWMVANGRLQIKVAIVLGDDGVPLDIETIQQRGIFHPKIGILEDKEGNVVTFGGSINESMKGWLYNDEHFYVFPNWIDSFKQISDKNLEKFNTCWNGLPNRFIVLDVPTAFSQQLIKIAPARIEELNLEKWYLKKRRELWLNQIEAIEAWKKNGYKGILAMATASGKTLAALEGARLAPESVVTVILVPTVTLLNQWANEVIPEFDRSAEIIVCGGNASDWKKLLPLKLAAVRKLGEGQGEQQSSRRLYVVSTMATASSEGFILAWKGIPPEKVQVIADEIHHVGAPIYQRCMELPSYRRMGLSATPERQWDMTGTRAIVDYFGPTVYEYGIKEAVKDGRLCHYEYHPFFAYLNKQEFVEFQRLTKEIEIQMARWKNKTKNKELELLPPSSKLSRLMEERAKIKKKASDKVRVFEEILSDDLSKPLIIFCEDQEQLQELKSVLKKKAVSFLVYTSEQSGFQREKAMKIFKKGDSDMLLAIRCLDEGVDVPECPACVIVASSTSTREFIQRRGRILRLAGKEKIAKLYDIIVIPADIKAGKELDIARSLIKQELDRVRHLVEAADNEWDVRNTIRKELAKYGLGALANI